MKYILRSWQTIVISTVFWCILNESFALNRLIEGVVVSVITYLFIYFLFADQSGTSISYRLSILALIKLTIILGWNIYLSSLRAIKIILFQSPSPAPTIVHVHTKAINKWHKCLIANAITLTPGTVTLNLTNDELIVLWLYPTSDEPNEMNKAILGPFEKALCERSLLND
ncbi:MAG: hypothetical protein CVV02_07045 [Firmicutes bacterium HGW-Firmicutes-7]|nr:MAG: hypothetical protein CVV02_07045 [Firmicutes bacterium HGW-Firmicutes-7]